MDLFPTDAQQAGHFVWSASLVFGVVVSAVVTLLLWLIIRTARTINQQVSRIWDTGQRVANNTVHIPALYRTNAVAAEILATAQRIDEAAAAIEAHAEGCPGCPHCMLDHGGAPA